MPDLGRKNNQFMGKTQSFARRKESRARTYIKFTPSMKITQQELQIAPMSM